MKASLSLLLAFMSPGLFAQEFKDFKIVRPTKSSTVTAAFGEIVNNTDKPITLERVEVSFAKSTELHTTLEENHVKKMRKLKEMTIPAGKSLFLKPGSDHIMFFDVGHEKLQADAEKLTFVFKHTTKDLSAPILNRDQL